VTPDLQRAALTSIIGVYLEGASVLATSRCRRCRRRAESKPATSARRRFSSGGFLPVGGYHTSFAIPFRIITLVGRVRPLFYSSECRIVE
jgi:hypothetical protein